MKLLFLMMVTVLMGFMGMEHFRVRAVEHHHAVQRDNDGAEVVIVQYPAGGLNG